MSCPHCGADHMSIKLIYCEKCGRMIQSFCTSCGEVVSEKPCGCTKEESHVNHVTSQEIDSTGEPKRLRIYDGSTNQNIYRSRRCPHCPVGKLERAYDKARPPKSILTDWSKIDPNDPNKYCDLFYCVNCKGEVWIPWVDIDKVNGG